MSDDISQILSIAERETNPVVTAGKPPSAFNEGAYLRAFPDVARAIADQIYKSPLQHYQDHGRHEDRLSHDDYLLVLKGRQLEGCVDFYGYNSPAGGWVFCGWTSEPWDEKHLTEVAARFQHREIIGEFVNVFYERRGLRGHGTGFVLFVKGTAESLGTLDQVAVQLSGVILTVPAAPTVHLMTDTEIASAIRTILLEHPETDGGRELLMLLSPRGYGRLRPALNSLDGFVDSYGYHNASGGWFFCGWTTRSWDDEVGPEKVILHFADCNIAGSEILTGFYPREDIEGLGTGFVMFVYASGRPVGSLSSIELQVHELSSFVRASATSQRLRDSELATRLKPMIGQATQIEARTALLSVLLRNIYGGADTLAGLTDRVLLELDDVIACPPGGLILMGWVLAKAGVIRAIRLRSGTSIIPVDLERGVKIDRPDVLASVGAAHGFDNIRCGFIVYLSGPISADPHIYLELETNRRQVGYRKLPEIKLDGIAAIKRILDVFDVRYAEVPLVYDGTIGPAVDLLNRHRLKIRPAVEEMAFGKPNPNPRFTIVVPLYGRLDFLEYQMAFLSGHSAAQAYEFIFVLDDPPRRREAIRLFNSVHRRFDIPCRLLLMEQNVGFAPANNAGLQAAQGTYVCFMNSDVFPGTPDWLEKLAQRLEDFPILGAVGPLLLYGDGTVQHEGMTFKTIAEFGDWQFGDHPRKGMKKSPVSGLRSHISITGACMLMRRDLARDLGGFDESYVIGDFEDSDLCLRLQAKGFETAVDLDTEMYHLERKSQTSSARAWRMNLTLYNAWVHQRHWGDTIASHPLRDLGKLVAPYAAVRPNA